MRFQNRILFGSAALLISLAAVPALSATPVSPIYGTLTLNGSGKLSGTAESFAIDPSNTTNTVSDPHFDQSLGSYNAGLSDSGFNSLFGSSSVYYVTGAISTTQNGAHTKWTGRAPAKFTYPTLGESVAGTEVAVLAQGSDTLTFYITEVDDVNIGNNTRKMGEFDGLGYIVLSDGTTSVTQDVNFTLQNTAIGNGNVVAPFTLTITAPTPEPSSLVFLGTGVLCLAGLVRWKARLAA